MLKSSKKIWMRMGKLLNRYTWENNVSFETDIDAFAQLSIHVPESATKDQIKELMLSSWLEAKRHEALKEGLSNGL